MSQNTKVGIILQSQQPRDAIHVAIVSVTATEHCPPGIHVSLVEGTTDQVEHNSINDRIGIIDPFLNQAVEPGELCYLFLYPGTVTSLRHSWTHPAFATLEEPTNIKTSSKDWLKAFAEKCGYSYNRMLQIASNWAEYAEGVRQNYDFDYYPSDETWIEFWKHYKIVTGEKVPNKGNEVISFSCSC